MDNSKEYIIAAAYKLNGSGTIAHKRLTHKNKSLWVDNVPSYVQYVLTIEYCRRNDYEHTCPHCEGSGMVWQTPEIKKLHEEYQWIEPPTGDGYQLWETTSEGSPISPVFATFDELCEWCTDNASTFTSFKATKEEWKRMLDDGFCLSPRR